MTTSIMLPPELVSVLNTLGFSWPEGDEGEISGMAGAWTDFADALGPRVADAHRLAEEFWNGNHDKAVEQFQAFWNDGEAPKRNLEDVATGASLVAAGLQVCAGALVALKVAVIAQLVALTVQIAQAIATAAVTFGASLAQIPVFREITRLLLDQALDIAIGTVLDG